MPRTWRTALTLSVGMALVALACDGRGWADEDRKALTRQKAAELLHEVVDGPVTTGAMSTSAEHVQKRLPADQRSRYFCHHYRTGSDSDARAKCTRSGAAVMSADCGQAQARVIGAGLTELVFLPNAQNLGSRYGYGHYCVALQTPELAKYRREGRYVVGAQQVTNVTGMTEPAPMQGRTISEVTFRVRKQGNDLGRLTAGLYIDAGRELDKELSGTAILVLYDDGWRVEKDTIRFK